MVKEGNMWAHLRYLLKDNFPNDSNEEIEKKLRTLSNYDDSWYNENIVLYPEQCDIETSFEIMTEENIL